MLSPDKPTPTAEDLDDARGLAWHVVDRAIGLYESSRADSRRAQELLAVDESINQWAELELRRAIDAEHHLVNVLLATDPGSNRFAACDLERFRAPTRGVRSGDATYLAAPIDASETDPGRLGGPAIMRLVVVRGGDAILDMDDVEAFTARTRRREAPPAVETPPGDDLWPAILRETIRLLGPEEVWRRVAGVPIRGTIP